MDVFARRLKLLRKQKRMTQENLGELINVTKVSISGYERGTRMPDPSTLIKIADIFDVSTDYLLGRSNVPRGDFGEEQEERVFPIQDLISRYKVSWENEYISTEDLEKMLIFLTTDRLWRKKKKQK